MTIEADNWNARHTTEPNIWQQLQELIDQSGRDEIVIQQQAEMIRDLEAEIRRLKAREIELLLDLIGRSETSETTQFYRRQLNKLNQPAPTLLHRER